MRVRSCYTLVIFKHISMMSQRPGRGLGLTFVEVVMKHIRGCGKVGRNIVHGGGRLAGLVMEAEEEQELERWWSSTWRVMVVESGSSTWNRRKGKIVYRKSYNS